MIELRDGVDVMVVPPAVPTVLVVPPANALVVLPVPGIPGPVGPAGDGGTSFLQTEPSATWIIPHGLGRYPSSVTVIIGSTELTTDVEYPDRDTVTITFADPVSGRAEIV
jgi:hypothetical protein